ncbi:glycosyltransferase family 9 protein [Streptomyces aidingensis]|uniref:ADP-heptose:LPS heptosyltransferase n=1 Tax=Streptomyces aidingensis TaxID=910347 RepID=A0A1I1LIV7_9ACTN|nr:glycosyltransferase family 9 protein [Streptomyces aidingensis]SFC69420.1 ADP-heptose:LPS heptosyltransferase [Streptomyces aidingensis]
MTARPGPAPAPAGQPATASAAGATGGAVLPTGARGAAGGSAGEERAAVVVLRALGLGDLLTGVPALRALRRACPGRRLLLAAPARLAEAAAATGVVDGLLPTTAADREVPDRVPWTGPPPELAVDLHGNGPASLAPLRALAPARLLGYALPGAPPWREDEPERARWCRLLAAHGIPAADPDDLRITAPAASPAPGAVVLHPGADAAARRWPADRFAAVGRALRAAGHRVAVTAGRGEAALARAVADAAGLPAGQVLGGDRDLPFGELCGLLAGARALVAGDTGPAHLATALGAPSVVLFGPVSPRVWGPPPGPRHRVLFRPGPDERDLVRPGDAHGRRPDPRLLRITPDDVLTALAGLGVTLGADRPERARA